MEVRSMNDAQDNAKSQSKPSNWVDAELAGEHGTTASPASVEDEKAPEFRPQNAHEVAAKVKEEASHEPGVIGKAKKALEEVDRQIAGEYEKRDDREAPDEVRDQTAGVEEAKAGTDSVDEPGTSNPRVASIAVEAETERFDGLINEPEDPARQPALDRERQ
jgi:hypothetical protein